MRIGRRAGELLTVKNAGEMEAMYSGPGLLEM